MLLQDRKVLNERGEVHFQASRPWFPNLILDGGGVREAGSHLGWKELLPGHFLICSNCHYRKLDRIHFCDEGINGYGENRVRVEGLNPRKGIKPWNSNEKLRYKHKGTLFYTCKTKCINMNQRLPLGDWDCASNSPRQISHASLPPTHSNEGQAPGSLKGPSSAVRLSLKSF